MKQCPQCGAGCIDEARFCPRCGGDVACVEPQAGDPYLGMTIAGQFVLREQVGEGGMGRVYRAEQIPLGKTVGVKIIHQHLIGDQTAAARFQMEARAASRLNHPNSIAVFDFGRTETGLLYIAMEFLVGKSLDRVMHSEGPLSIGRSIDILVQVLEALGAAHELGIIHRDLKPENIFVEPRSGGGDLVKVLDFGIAKFREDTVGITQSGMVAGTPEYMSPEQARGDALDARSDLYACGVILYQLLTEALPFTGRNAMEVMLKHVDEPPVPPSVKRSDREIPPSLDEIVLFALAKRRDRRCSSAQDLRNRLVAWAEQAPAELLTSRQHPSAEAPTVPASSSSWLRPSLEGVATSRHMGRVETIGRAAEQRVLSTLLREGAGALWLMGPRGIGKTRLCEDLEREAASKAVATYWARPDSTRARDPLCPIRRLICEILGISAPADEQELEEVMEDAELAKSENVGLRELFAVHDGRELATQTRFRELGFAVKAVVRSAAASKPIVLIFDGVERYDGASRSLTEQLLRQALSLGVVMVASAADALPPPAGIESRAIGTLEPQAALMLAMGSSPVTAIDDIVAASEGNPLWVLHLSELVAAGGPMRPGRVVDVLAAQLETLPAGEREALQWLAVCGDWADTTTLQVVGGELAEERMRSLVERGLVLPKDHGYAFRDAFLGEVAHASLPAEVGRSLHRRLYEQQPQGKDASPVVRAYHAALADLGFAAIDAADRAGCWAAVRLDDESAALWFHRGQEMARRELGRGQVNPETLNSLAIGLARKEAEVLRRRNERMTADGVLHEALDIAVGRPVDQIRLRADMARLALEGGAVDRALRELKVARTDMQQAPVSDWLAGTVLRATGIALLRIGDFTGAKAAFDEGIRRAMVGNTACAPSQVLMEVADAYLSAGHLEAGHEILRRTLEVSTNGVSLGGKLRALEALAELENQQGTASAADWFERTLSTAKELGDRSRVASLLLRLGRVYARGGKRERSFDCVRESVSLAESLGLADIAQAGKADLVRVHGVVPTA